MFEKHRIIIRPKSKINENRTHFSGGTSILFSMTSHFAGAFSVFCVREGER